jgi:FkbM family methyltransferase
MLKKIINDCIRLTGYQLIKVPYSNKKIRSGSYKWLQNFEIRSVFDVGANEGQFAKIISRILPAARIYSFEPLNNSFKKLKSNLANNNRIKIFNFALGDEERESTIYRSEFSASSSIIGMTDLHKEAFPYTRNVSEEKIFIKRFDDIVKDLKLEKQLLMKIDVQGFELKVLKGAEETLKHVAVIILETSFYELYQSQPLFKDIYNYLIGSGFNYFGSLEQIYDERDGKILQSDSIFIKN